MKKVIALILCFAMMLSLAACGASSTDSSAASKPAGNETEAVAAVKDPSNHETYKIAVGYRAGIDIPAAKALFDQLEEAYNVEFMYSEMLTDINAELDFLDNAISSGCQAYLTWTLFNIEQIASVCAQNEIYYAVHTQWHSEYDGSSKYWVGSCGFANPPKAQMYKEMLAEFLADDDGTGGILIASGQASSNNLQHIETTTATLEAIAEYYGLTYTKEISELVISDSGVKAENDKGVNVYVLPGTTAQDGYTTQLNTLLSSGDYKIFASFSIATDVVNVVLEAEGVAQKNVVVGGIAVISDSLKAIFEGTDPFGNPPVDYMSMQYSSVTQAALFAMLYNALNGYGDIYRTPDDSAQGFGCGQVTIKDTTNSAVYCDLDDADVPESLVATLEFVDTLIAKDDSYTAETWEANFVNCDCTALAEAAIKRISK